MNTGRKRFLARVGAVTAVVLLLGACGGGDDDDAGSDRDDETSETTAPEVAEGTTYYAEAKVPEVQIYDAEDATEPTQALPNPGDHGVPLVFLVDGLDIQQDRVPVYLPTKPNGSKGWIDTAQVDFVENPYSIKVQLSAFKLTVNKGSETIIDTPVGLGQVGMETPQGMYFIKELIQNPNPDDVYGPYAYGISAY